MDFKGMVRPVLKALFCAFLATPAAVAEGVRMPVDTVGYAVSREQVEAVVAWTDSLEGWRIGEQERMYPRIREGEMLGAICPHDDYLYAAPVYWHVMRRVRAPLLVLFGVCHAGRRRGIQGKLVFDGYEAWRGPYGDTPVSQLREEIIAALPDELVLVSNELHAGEHSLEALIPYLQHYRRGERLEILPVLVTRLPGPLFEAAADTLASVLAEAIGGRGLEPGLDFQILISADCVHYGDEQWGGRNYAPYGIDESGFSLALEEDLSIIEQSLIDELSRERIARFSEMVERDDLEWPYKVTWCGVYSIPFGLAVMLGLAGELAIDTPEGFLLRYGASWSPERSSLEVTGLGTTNIATLRHWVGYAAIGYW